MFASLIPLFFVTSGVPIVPQFGFLMLLGWRLVRPGLFPVWVGFPLGLFDDLFNGQPFGSSILIWSATMIIVEIIEARLPRRSFAQDWTIFGLIIIAAIVFGVLFSGGTGSLTSLPVVAPQALLSVLIFPIVARVVARLDRMRLRRVKRIR